jgi:hypothetical protein
MSMKSGQPSDNNGHTERHVTDQAGSIVYNQDGSIQHIVNGNHGSPEPSAADAAGRVALAPGASAEEYVEGIAELIEEKFMALLKARLADRGGHLSDQDVADMGAEFRAQRGEIKTVFLEAVATYAKSREHSREKPLRGDPFRRMMVHRFEARLAPEADLHTRPDLLSRRVLPGFFGALALMLGQDNLAQCREDAESLTTGLRRRLGDAFTWQAVYDSKEGRRITLHAEILMARHFKDVEKRIDWLVALINGNMIPLDPWLPGADWTFSEAAARRMLHDLFADLRATFGNKKTRTVLAGHLNKATLARLERLARALG